MTKMTNKILLAGAVALAAGFSIVPASAQTIRLAFGDLPGIESITMLAAIERARQAGANIEVIALNDEDLAAQAIVGGQADVMAFPSRGNPLNLLGRLFLRLMSWLAYAY